MKSVNPIYCHQCGKKLKEIPIKDNVVLYCKKCGLYFPKSFLIPMEREGDVFRRVTQ